VGTVPRGLAASPDGTSLYVSDYEGGRVFRFDLPQIRQLAATNDTRPDVLRNSLRRLTPVQVMGTAPGAKRHIVIAAGLGRMFVSDMYSGRIDVYSLAGGELISSVAVGPKLNTIALDPQENYLYISSRGRNNPRTYLIAGPDFGKVYVMDARTLEVVDWVWGGNQPTGLAVSPDGTVLAFTDFLDDRLELYDVSGYSAVNPLLRMLGRWRNEALQVLQGGDEFPAAVELIEEHAETGAAGG
jgi:DNA-binding beta-propeller fold protein YncE